MTDPQVVTAAASRFLGMPVEAAAVFGLQTLPEAMLGATAGGLAGDLLSPDSSGLGGAVGAAAGAAAARQAAASSEGLAVRMVLAVTEDAFVLLDWSGDACSREFMRFDRSTAHVTVSKFGLERHVRLTDPSGTPNVELSGSTSFLSSESKADKIVLSLLGG